MDWGAYWKDKQGKTCKGSPRTSCGDPFCTRCWSSYPHAESKLILVLSYTQNRLVAFVRCFHILINFIQLFISKSLTKCLTSAIFCNCSNSIFRSWRII